MKIQIDQNRDLKLQKYKIIHICIVYAILLTQIKHQTIINCQISIVFIVNDYKLLLLKLLTSLI